MPGFKKMLTRAQAMKQQKNRMTEDDAYRVEAKKGGKVLKKVKPSQKGLKKLPRKVRNKMGYMKNGGRAK